MKVKTASPITRRNPAAIGNVPVVRDAAQYADSHQPHLQLTASADPASLK